MNIKLLPETLLVLVDGHEVLLLLLLAHDPGLEASRVITRGRLRLHVVGIVRIGTWRTGGQERGCIYGRYSK